MSSRRLARQQAVAPVSQGAENPHKVTQQSLETPWGEARGWFKGASVFRVKIEGVCFGWGKAPAVWAGIQDGSFHPSDFGVQSLGRIPARPPF